MKKKTMTCSQPTVGWSIKQIKKNFLNLENANTILEIF